MKSILLFTLSNKNYHWQRLRLAHCLPLLPLLILSQGSHSFLDHFPGLLTGYFSLLWQRCAMCFTQIYSNLHQNLHTLSCFLSESPLCASFFDSDWLLNLWHSKHSVAQCTFETHLFYLFIKMFISFNISHYDNNGFMLISFHTLASCVVFQEAGFTSQWAAWCCSEAEPTCSVTGGRSLLTGCMHVSLAMAGHTASSAPLFLSSDDFSTFLSVFPSLFPPSVLHHSTFCLHLLFLMFSHAVMHTAAADL